MAVVTVSRLSGIGGREFARRLAETLGYDYVDKEILARLSNALSTGEGSLDLYETGLSGSARSLAELAAKRYPGVGGGVPDTASYIEALRAVVREIAVRDRVVLVGRGGQFLLADDRRAIHLRLVAPPGHFGDDAVEAFHARACSAHEIEKAIRERRKAQADFITRHFGEKIEDPLHYHLVINLGRTGLPRAVNVAVAVSNGVKS